MVSDVMSLIPIHEETFARDTENLHCFVPRYFSHHYRCPPVIVLLETDAFFARHV